MSKNPSPSGRLRGQTVLVTGTTKGGIGYETARLLGDEGATVLTHGRTQEAARASVESLVGDGNGAGRFIPVAADLSSIAGARQLANAARAAAPQGIHGLVNNAGAGFTARRLSPDGIEMTMAINHVAVAALTDALLDLLHAGADSLGRPSRVVSMTALIEGRGKVETDWSFPGKYSQTQAYFNAKLTNLLWVYALARRLDGHGITVNAVSPGSVRSGFGAKAGGTFGLMARFGAPLYGPPSKGSRGVVRIMTDPGLATATGGYHTPAKLKKSSKKSRTQHLQEQVYLQTERLLRAHCDNQRV
ncbi:short chain dehydrogenase [Mycobacterium lentiflavum]|uniref:SDR family NAD(P)-dependent oxidoreductase n=1 Tax=Mycobacterium lentiflavum TaxID=141349 RepID=A0A0E4CLR1_MYCLN|nr:SDR family NAD(P)-dependent oxidoreductase [Mycobacterium lentiflavum]MEE3063783.1 SDR family NAD(P)-dependent oxidoreductase [Actinomycetota bacterium]ULP43221.1 SDR family NAD(P)-dependent oxidoreductase [Mycobacterium lentiflavum]CQD06056.1 short chain dehydrogenase [Mycobacterium lentiflavum]